MVGARFFFMLPVHNVAMEPTQPSSEYIRVKYRMHEPYQYRSGRRNISVYIHIQNSS
jgi:hypothetical protein